MSALFDTFQFDTTLFDSTASVPPTAGKWTSELTPLNWTASINIGNSPSESSINDTCG